MEGDTDQVMVGSEFRRTSWFPDVRLNYAENILRKGAGEEIAVIAYDETGKKKHLTFDALRNNVTALAHYFQKLGLGKGDHVGGVVPNCIETIVFALATGAIGATWFSCSADQGFQGIYDRFSQIRPKLLVGVAGYTYNGKPFPITRKIERVMGAIAEIDKGIIV